jgi:hypothetical protein
MSQDQVTTVAEAEPGDEERTGALVGTRRAASDPPIR